VLTLGQRIVSEVTAEYRAQSVLSTPAPATFTGSEGYVPFQTQPTGRYYAVQATLTWTGSTVAGDMPNAGIRVLASDSEWTDILVRSCATSPVPANIPTVRARERNPHRRPHAQLPHCILFVIPFYLSSPRC
jgi:hypothetical protein